MYIRRTQSRLHNGVTYHILRLVQSERDGKQVRQRTLLNLGRHFFLDRELWPLLCQQVEEGLFGQSGLALGIPGEVEDEVNRVRKDRGAFDSGFQPPSSWGNGEGPCPGSGTTTKEASRLTGQSFYRVWSPCHRNRVVGAIFENRRKW